METNRRQFIATALAGGVAATTSPLSSYGSQARNPNYPTLDEVLKQPVLKKELFTTPVIIETLELLRYEGNFRCRQEMPLL